MIDLITKEFVEDYENGKVTDAYKVFGSHVTSNGVEFATYAPNAKKVRLRINSDTFIDMNNYYGVWYAMVTDIINKYMYEITGQDDSVVLKADPYANYATLRPERDSIPYVSLHQWNDDAWVNNRPDMYNKPMLTYEMSLLTWKRKSDGGFYTARELAPMVLEHLKKYNYTHVELMPIYEFPYDPTGGYQVTGYYATTSRMGTPDDFKYFVDYMHQNNIGVILDWIPGHTCQDDFGLLKYDGSTLYEYDTTKYSFNKDWGTYNLDIGKGHTKSFFISNLDYYLKNFHVDGFRVDAAMYLIYRLGNDRNGMNEEGMKFIQDCSEYIFGIDENIIFVAEDLSTEGDITVPVKYGGLGYNYKWDMAGQHDITSYYKMNYEDRKRHHYLLTRPFSYLSCEKWWSYFSHDEVWNYGTLYSQVYGNTPQEKYANCKTAFGYMVTRPGKKLFFMGEDIGNREKWNCNCGLDDEIIPNTPRDKYSLFIKDLFELYVKCPALWERDYSFFGFEWILPDDAEQSIIAFVRRGVKKGEFVVVIINSSTVSYDSFNIGVPTAVYYDEILNSDAKKYGGRGLTNDEDVILVENFPNHRRSTSITIQIPAKSIIILKPSMIPDERSDAAALAKDFVLM